MGFIKLSNPGLTTSVQFAGDTLNKVLDVFTGINIAASDATFNIDINTPFKFRSGKFVLADSPNTHKFTFVPPTISVDKNWTFPSNLVDGDDVLFRTTVQTIEGKVISALNNAITDLSSSNLPADVVYTTTSQTLTNKILTSPQISTIINGSATLTLPGSTQIILGRSTIDTLTNKTLDSILNTLKNIGSFKYTIFKDGSTYYCRNNLTGVIEVSNSSPNTVIAFPLINGGSAYVQSGDYTLTSGPTTYFDFPVETLYCELYLAPDARILVPQGFTGTVFRFKNTTTLHCTGNRLMGGYIRESGTPVRAWTAILFEGSGDQVASKGVFYNTVEYVRIWDALNGVRFNCDSTSTTGFVTQNVVENMFIYRCKGDFVGYQMDVAYTTNPINGSHRNRFQNLLLQSSSLTAEENCVGVNNIMGRENTFIGVYVADFSGKNRACVIHADSDSTIIDGGSMTLPGNTTHTTPLPLYEDNSTAQNTKIRDMYRHNQIGRITPGIGGNAIEIVPTSGQTTNTMSWWQDTNKYERFYIQKTSTDIKFDSARSNASGALRPMLFRMNDTVGGGAGTIESFRVEADGSLRVGNNRFKLRDGGSDHNITITVPDVAGNYNLSIPTITGNDTFATVSGGVIVDASIASGAAIGWSKISKSGSVLGDISNVVLTSPADQDILVRNSSGNWVNLAKGTNNRMLSISAGGLVAWNFIGNANITAHTSTQITITSKAQLNSQIVYKDENDWLTNSHVADGTLNWAKISKSGSLLSDISNVILTTPTSQDILVRNGSSQFVNLAKGSNNTLLGVNGSGNLAYTTIGDSNIASHTSTKITITDKSHLNSQIAYKDETAWLTAAMISASHLKDVYGCVRGRKTGEYLATSTAAGRGIFEGGLTMGTNGSLGFDNVNGKYHLLSTGALSGNANSWRYINTYTCRGFNAYIGYRIMFTTSISNNRLHTGLKSNPSTVVADGTDDPLAGVTGIMIAQRAGDTNFWIAYNTGAGSSTWQDTGVPIVQNTHYKLELRADEANSKWQFNINDAGWTDVSGGGGPGSTAEMGMFGGFQTAEGVIHSCRLYAIETTSDK